MVYITSFSVSKPRLSSAAYRKVLPLAKGELEGVGTKYQASLPRSVPLDREFAQFTPILGSGLLLDRRNCALSKKLVFI